EGAVYMTFLQAPTGRGQMNLLVRFASDAAGIAPEVRREVAALDPDRPVFPIRTLAVQMDAALIRERLLALLSTVFAALAVVLSGIGLYGVIAYSVGRRTHEIGIRLAVGALPAEARSLVVRETLALTATGI